ncbi:hypothetical protein [Yunchengibacter salinarum]|uniref:hypothetical protein n=1 Tax=Yunchengibacter salinarum TaxID=3133399 RepID=UPI0035B608B7
MTDKTGDPLGGTAPAPSQMAAELNAGFAFFLDCVVNLFVLAGVLGGGFDFPDEVLFGKVIPGSIMGIVVGNVLYAAYTRRVVRQTGNHNHTSIPLGIDLPSVFAMSAFVIGPAYVSNIGEMGETGAATLAWQLGMAAALWMGVIKVGLSFVGTLVQKGLPQAALIGAMAGIATVYLGAEAIFGIFDLPEVGVFSLMIMAYALIAGHRLPGNMPGAIIAIVAGTVLYYVLALAGAGDGYVINAAPDIVPAVPLPTLAGVMAMGGPVLNHLGLILPFALLIAASSVNIVSGARLSGDTYNAGRVVQIDAVATIASGLFGGVVQTTPYFGHATYKRMGARSAYALGVVALVGVGGFLGLIAFASKMIPDAALKPILVVVASDIIRLAFASADARHAPAVLFTLVPAILNYTALKVDELYSKLSTSVAQGLSDQWRDSYFLFSALSKGYVLTSLIWGSMLVWIIDGRLRAAALAAFAASAFTLFGVIHSVLPSSGMYMPWAIPDAASDPVLAHRLAAGYAIAGLMLLAFAGMRRVQGLTVYQPDGEKDSEIS